MHWAPRIARSSVVPWLSRATRRCCIGRITTAAPLCAYYGGKNGSPLRTTASFTIRFSIFPPKSTFLLTGRWPSTPRLSIPSSAHRCTLPFWPKTPSATASETVLSVVLQWIRNTLTCSSICISTRTRRSCSWTVPASRCTSAGTRCATILPR